MVLEDDDDSTAGVPKGAYVPVPILGWVLRALRRRKRTGRRPEEPDAEEDT